MTEQREVYMIVFEHPADDCYQPHVRFYANEAKALEDIASYPTREGRVRFIKGVMVVEYEGEPVSEFSRRPG